jgi:putative oxidoreductase
MALRANPSSHPLLSRADGLAAGALDFVLLVGRVLLGWIFVASAWGKLTSIGGFVNYLTSLKVPNPGLWAWPGAVVEFVLGATLILGVGTRYAALLGVVFVAVATALAHRYWEYPAPAAGNQYNHFLKNLAIIGGMLAIFATGAGRFSIDAMLSKRR